MIKKTTQIPAVKINFMSEEIYDSITPSSDELYAVEVTDNLSIPLLTPMWLDHIANDIRWLRADTFSWQSGDVYKGVYNLLKDEYDHGTPETEGGGIPHWHEGQLPAEGTWYAGASDTRIVAVCHGRQQNGYSSNVGAISFDGINWSQTTLPVSTCWAGVAYGNGVFVAISGDPNLSSSVAAYSTDGITWTQTALPSSGQWYTVTYGNGVFVTFGYDSKVAYSTDGITWTGTTSVASARWTCTAYGNGTFVALGINGVCCYSTDGINWTAGQGAANRAVTSVTYGNGKFIATTGSGYLWTSTDGHTWTEYSSGISLNQAYIAFGNGLFTIASHDIMTTGSTKLAYSEDGVTWTIETSQLSLWWSSNIFGLGRFLALPWEMAFGTYAPYYYSTRPSITFTRTPSGFQIVSATFDDEVANLYNNRGIAWFYILDTENKRFKLPRTKYGFTGLRTQPGNYVPESLPNITGRVFMCEDSYNVVSGAFYNGGAAPGRTTNTGGGFFVDFDASKSSDIYQDDAHVQQRSTEMYLYFYVGGTGLNQGALPAQAGHTGEVLVTDGENADWKPMAVRNIGETVFSLIPLTDACLHLLDGTLLDGTGSYAEFVTYMQGLSVTYPDLFTSEADWQTSVTTYGVCGKFVYDSANNTLRLPRVTGIIEGTLDITALGDLVEAGLPDHNHEVSIYDYADSGHTSYLYKEQGNWQYTFQTTNASASNTIYGNSDTVQPQTIKGYYYIVVASSVKKDYVIDVDNVMTDLSYKADKSTLSESGLYITTYVNGTEWYREYFSDSTKTVRVWLEQGGKVTGSSQGQVIQINLLRPFTNANYTINATQERSGGSATSFPMIVINSLSTTQFNLSVDSGTVNDWYACGI